MRRPWLAAITTVLQALLALALIALAFVFSGLLRMFDAWDLAAAGILGIISLPAAVGFWGLWKATRWGWWLALVIDSLGLTLFLWDPIIRRVKPDSDELAFIGIFALLVLLLLLSPVRRFFLRREETSVEAGAGS